MRLIWATRGKAWGYRFLRDGGLSDPLSTYESAFSNVGNSSEAWATTEGRGALRFPDPLERQDKANRVILHEFVVFEPEASQISSVDEGREIVWPLVADEYDKLWGMGADGFAD